MQAFLRMKTVFAGIDYFILANINKLGHEDHIPGQVRDWNEELQITKELSKKTLPERLIRERAMFKVKPIDNETNKRFHCCPFFLFLLVYFFLGT
jgi:hypothetical protein